MERKLFKITTKEALEYVLKGKTERLYVSDKAMIPTVIRLAGDVRIEIDEVNRYRWYILER